MLVNYVCCSSPSSSFYSQSFFKELCINYVTQERKSSLYDIFPFVTKAGSLKFRQNRKIAFKIHTGRNSKIFMLSKTKLKPRLWTNLLKNDLKASSINQVAIFGDFIAIHGWFDLKHLANFVKRVEKVQKST